LKKTAACSNVLRVKADGKTVDYYLDDKGKNEVYHKNCCACTKDTAAAKATVTGVVTEKDGKNLLKASHEVGQLEESARIPPATAFEFLAAGTAVIATGATLPEPRLRTSPTKRCREPPQVLHGQSVGAKGKSLLDPHMRPLGLRGHGDGGLLQPLDFRTNRVGVRRTADIAIKACQTIQEIFPVLDARYRKSLLQDLFRPSRIVLLVPDKPNVAIGPTYPAPAPVRLIVQPLAVQLLALLGHAHGKVSFRQVVLQMDQEQAILLQAAQQGFEEREPLLQERAVLQAGMVQFPHKVLHPVEQRAGRWEMGIELLHGAEGHGFQDVPDAFPGCQPETAGAGQVAAGPVL
jgi:hypothetical protein